jgi:hypothetical protein
MEVESQKPILSRENKFTSQSLKRQKPSSVYGSDNSVRGDKLSKEYLKKFEVNNSEKNFSNINYDSR